MLLDTQPFLSGYAQLKIPIVDGDGNPAWPELFPLDKIEQMREMVGLRHFSSQMMLEFINAESTRLDPGALHFYNGEFDSRIAKLTGHGSLVTGYSCYWDPSGGRVRGDASVVVLVYRDDKNRRAFIHDVRYMTVDENDTHPLATQCGVVLDFMAAHNVRKIGIEINGLGNALPEVIRDTATKRAQPVIVEKVINHTRKEMRILDAIEPLLTTGRLYANDKIRNTPLLAEMLGWSPIATGGHDDGLDALAGALRMSPIPIRAAGQIIRPINAKTDFKV